MMYVASGGARCCATLVFTILCVFVLVRVRIADAHLTPTMSVLVNQKLVIPNQTAKNNNMVVVYPYLVGDTVEFTCVSNTKLCKVLIANDYFKDLIRNIGEATDGSDSILSSSVCVGMRRTLYPVYKHHSTCSFICPDNKYNSHVDIKFELENKEKHYGPINNKMIQKNEELINDDLEYNCNYFIEKRMNFVCEVHNISGFRTHDNDQFVSATDQKDKPQLFCRSDPGHMTTVYAYDGNHLSKYEIMEQVKTPFDCSMSTYFKDRRFYLHLGNPKTSTYIQLYDGTNKLQCSSTFSNNHEIYSIHLVNTYQSAYHYQALLRTEELISKVDKCKMASPYIGHWLAPLVCVFIVLLFTFAIWWWKKIGGTSSNEQFERSTTNLHADQNSSIQDNVSTAAEATAQHTTKQEAPVYECVNHGRVHLEEVIAQQTPTYEYDYVYSWRVSQKRLPGLPPKQHAPTMTRKGAGRSAKHSASIPS